LPQVYLIRPLREKDFCPSFDAKRSEFPGSSDTLRSLVLDTPIFVRIGRMPPRTTTRPPGRIIPECLFHLYVDYYCFLWYTLFISIRNPFTKRATEEKARLAPLMPQEGKDMPDRTKYEVKTQLRLLQLTHRLTHHLCLECGTDEHVLRGCFWE